MLKVKWEREEVELLLKMYLEVELNGGNIEIEAVKLSELLNKRADELGIKHDDKYRNVVGIRMKYQNINYLMTDGKYGLSGSSKLEEEVVNEYKRTL